MAFYLLSKIEADILEKAINFLTAFTAILFLNYRMKIQTPENYDSLWVMRGRPYDFNTQTFPVSRFIPYES